MIQVSSGVEERDYGGDCKIGEIDATKVRGLPLRHQVVLGPALEEGLAESGAAPAELAGEGKVGAVSCVGKVAAALEAVQIEEGAVVDVVELVVLERVVLVATVLAGVDVRQRVYVVLAVSRVAVRQDVRLLLVHVALVELTHHLVECDVVLGRAHAARHRGHRAAAAAGASLQRKRNLRSEIQARGDPPVLVDPARDATRKTDRSKRAHKYRRRRTNY